MCIITELKSLNNIIIVFLNTLAIFKAISQVCIQFGACSVEKSGVFHLGFWCSRLSKSAIYFSYGKSVFLRPIVPVSIRIVNTGSGFPIQLISQSGLLS
jgi:hypothetical protein